MPRIRRAGEKARGRPLGGGLAFSCPRSPPASPPPLCFPSSPSAKPHPSQRGGEPIFGSLPSELRQVVPDRQSWARRWASGGGQDRAQAFALHGLKTVDHQSPTSSTHTRTAKHAKRLHLHGSGTASPLSSHPLATQPTATPQQLRPASRLASPTPASSHLRSFHVQH